MNINLNLKYLLAASGVVAVVAVSGGAYALGHHAAGPGSRSSGPKVSILATPSPSSLGATSNATRETSATGDPSARGGSSQTSSPTQVITTTHTVTVSGTAKPSPTRSGFAVPTPPPSSTQTPLPMPEPTSQPTATAQQPVVISSAGAGFTACSGSQASPPGTMSCTAEVSFMLSRPSPTPLTLTIEFKTTAYNNTGGPGATQYGGEYDFGPFTEAIPAGENGGQGEFTITFPLCVNASLSSGYAIITTPSDYTTAKTDPRYNGPGMPYCN